MVDEEESVEYSAAAWLSYYLLFAAQNAATQFFSLYLKYLGMSAADAGAIRALQTWAGVAASRASVAMSRTLCGSARGRRALAALLLLSSVAGYVSLVFVPPFAVPRDVTHCSRTSTAAPSWRLLSLQNRNVTTKLEANESFHHVVQEIKDKTFNTGTSPSEIKSSSDLNELQSKTTAPTLDMNEDNNWQKLSNPSNREMEVYDKPKHNSPEINAKHTFEDKVSGKKISQVSSLNEERKGILNSYHKIENPPFIFKYELPVPENSQKNNLPYIPDGENESDMLAKPDDTDYRYQLHHLRPAPSINQHNYQNQWSDKNNIDEQQYAGVSEAEAVGGSKTFVNPEWETFQKIFLQHQPKNTNSVLKGQKDYQYKQPFHIHRHQEQQLNEGDNDPYYSNNLYKIHNIQQEDEQEEQTLDLSKPYDQVNPLYRDEVPPQDFNQNRIVKRRVHTRISNSDAVKSDDGLDLFHLELVNSNHIVLRGITARKGALYNMTDLNDTVLNNHLNSISEISNSSSSVTDSMYAESIKYFATLQGFGASKYGSWSTVFYTVFAISVFLEVSCQSTLVWILRICGVMTQNTCEVLKELATSSRVLVGWSVVVCPLVGLVAALSPCPYQVTAHMAAAAALTFCALILLPLIAPVSRSRKRKPSKPSYRKSYEDLHATLITRFSISLRMGITGCITACNLEFMMWYMEAQETFSHNYEYLYCGYSATASITQFLLNRLLRQRNEDAEVVESESEDETGGNRWQPHRPEASGHRRWWWLWELGTLLLATEQLAARLRPVWLLPPLLGVLQGAGTALSVAGAGASYGVGYGCGCLAAGLIVQAWGAAALFQVVSLGASVCAAVAAIIRGVARCSANQREQARAHSFSIASAESDASSDGEENEIAETDDWLVQALQRDEYRQAKKSHRIEC